MLATCCLCSHSAQRKFCQETGEMGKQTKNGTPSVSLICFLFLVWNSRMFSSTTWQCNNRSCFDFWPLEHFFCQVLVQFSVFLLNWMLHINVIREKQTYTCHLQNRKNTILLKASFFYRFGALQAASLFGGNRTPICVQWQNFLGQQMSLYSSFCRQLKPKPCQQRVKGAMDVCGEARRKLQQKEQNCLKNFLRGQVRECPTFPLSRVMYLRFGFLTTVDEKLLENWAAPHIWRCSCCAHPQLTAPTDFSLVCCVAP